MKIEICGICKGTGYTIEDVGTHQSEYVSPSCHNCKGTGRVLTRSYNLCVPYTTDTDEIYDTDSKILNLIRELKKK